MTYKDVVDRIKEITFDHKMLVDFGYGQISDIKTRAEGSDGDVNDADYPYLFLNPSAHVRTQTQITYNFNMVVMDMAREEEGDPYQNFLAIQSDCIQYIDDVIARLYFHYTDQPEVSFDLSYTPFYERFQDDLAGATANLSITVPTNINDCISPFNPNFPTPVGQLQLHVVSNQNQQYEPDTQQPPFQAQTVVLDTQGGWRPDEPFNFYTPQVDGTWTWVLDGYTRLNLDQGDWPSNPEMVYNYNGQIVPVTITNWPQVQPELGVDTPFTAMWTGQYYAADNNFITWNWLNDPVVEDEFLILAGTSLKGYFTPSV